MIAKAASTADPLQGFLTMTLFGIGTWPALYFTGFFASLLSFRLRLFGERTAALSIVVMGLILLIKGVRHYG